MLNIYVRWIISVEIRSNHRSVLGKLRLKMLKPTISIPRYLLKYNIKSFKNEMSRELYKRWLPAKILQNKIEGEDNVESTWEQLQNSITATEKELILPWSKRNSKKRKEHLEYEDKGQTHEIYSFGGRATF